MKSPQFEDPINTVNDLVDQNIRIFEASSYSSSSSYYDDFFIDSSYDSYMARNTPEWDYVANTMVPADYDCGYFFETQICAKYNGTWEHLIKYHLHGNKTHAFISGYLDPRELEVMPEKKNWWRSEKILTDTNPFMTVFTSRDWILNEVNFFSIL